jgi:hypothetical protein
MGSGNLANRVQALGVAASGLLAVDLMALSDAALVEAVKALRPVICQVQAAETRLVGAVHLRGAASVEGAVSTAAWLRNRLHDGEATTKVKSSVALERLPLVAAAFADGHITGEHVAVIAQVAADITDAALAGGAEQQLVDKARKQAPKPFTREAVRIRDTLDPEAADRRRLKRLTDRWLHVDRTFDGAVSVSGLLDPDAGELLIATLAGLMPPPRPDDNRTAAQRRADALLDLCRLGADHTATAGGEKPHVLVTVDLATLRNQLSTDPAAALTTGATLGSGWAVGPETARRLACDAKVIPLVLGGPSQPLDVGRLTRSCPPALRRALVFRDGGCRYPGCDRPPEWTDAHHIRHWIDLGPTSLTNCVLLCRHHHVYLHEHHQAIRLDPATATITVHDRRGNLVGTSHPRGRVPVPGQPPGTVHRKPQPCNPPKREAA